MVEYSVEFWEWLEQTNLIQGDPAYYRDGKASEGEWAHAIQTAFNNSAPGSLERISLVERLVDMGAIEGDPKYWYEGTQESLGADWDNLAAASESYFGSGGSGDGSSDVSSTPEIPDQRQGTKTVGDQTIPSSSRLVRVSNPAGSDAGELFYLVGDVYGVEMAYLIGSREDLEAVFGSVDAFGSFTTVTQAEFDGSDVLHVGTVDEVLGSSESLQAQFDRDMRSAGLENPPAWIVDDREAMVRYVNAVNEGWSAERTWGSLAGTQAFKTRFAGLDTVMGQMGTSSLVDGVAEYVKREAGIRAELLSSRGPNTDTSVEYVSSLIGSGWKAAEVGELLAYEARVKENPDALDNLNEILAFQGLPSLDVDDFISFLQDQDALTLDPSFTPGELYEGINDALRFQALADQGLEISTEFASSLGEGTSSGIMTEGSYSDRARMAAIEVARNADDLELGRYDLQRDDIIAAMFGEESPSGKSTSEVSELLEKMGKERSKRATGFASVPSYVDAMGRLRVQGMSNM